MHAVEFLKAPEKREIPAIVVLSGKERFFRQPVIHAICQRILGENAELGPASFRGDETELKTVVDTLLTVSMWSPRQVVVVESADEFVTNYREALERYFDRPAKKSVLVLDVQFWPATTRLAKKAAATGLLIECAPLKQGNTRGLRDWIVQQAGLYKKRIGASAAELLVEQAGTDLGLLDQELNKLATFMGAEPEITPRAVQQLVGGWKAETVWEVADAVREGQLGAAFELCEKLFVAGEPPVRMLGALSSQFRPVVRGVDQSRDGTPLRQALSEAGVKPFRIREFLDYVTRYKVPRIHQIAAHLLSADLDLKGASALDERITLEKLLIRLAARPAGAAPQAGHRRDTAPGQTTG